MLYVWPEAARTIISCEIENIINREGERTTLLLNESVVRRLLHKFYQCYYVAPSSCFYVLWLAASVCIFND